MLSFWLYHSFTSYKSGPNYRW